MAEVRKMKPTSPGRRAMVRVSRDGLHRGGPHPGLSESKRRIDGRNACGRITVRHRGGGHKRRYRFIDFRRDKDGIAGRVERLEYDPNRSAHIALICYADGERRYILAPKGLAVGDSVQSGENAPIRPGNAMPISSLPMGAVVHCVELKPGRGGQLARAAGASAQLLAIDEGYALLRLKSGEVRKVRADCRATLGETGNSAHFLRKIGKAGINRHRGLRPKVRAIVMNPIDHPMGGGEGKSKSNRAPCSPWGQPAKGYRTRRNKRTDKMIVSRRKTGKKGRRG